VEHQPALALYPDDAGPAQCRVEVLGQAVDQAGLIWLGLLVRVFGQGVR
jgi:hypothetical protein